MRIYWSASHFRNAPSQLRLDGMAPPSNLDDISYFDIEPITGVVVGVQQRSQLNLGMLNQQKWVENIMIFIKKSKNKKNIIFKNLTFTY